MADRECKDTAGGAWTMTETILSGIHSWESPINYEPSAVYS